MTLISKQNFHLLRKKTKSSFVDLSREDQLKKRYDLLLSDIKEHKIVESVCPVAVSKYSPFSDIEILYNLGHRDFGENRIESLKEKSLQAIDCGLDEIRWHFIGNIQSGKIKDISAIDNLVAIHSIEKFKHLKSFYAKVDKPIDFFIQFNTSGEEQKGGLISLEELQSFNDLIDSNKDSLLSFKGLMTMGKIRSENQLVDARNCFFKLASLRDQIDSSLDLSMGMSSDYKVALELGASHIRVGSSLFLS